MKVNTTRVLIVFLGISAHQVENFVVVVLLKASFAGFFLIKM